MSIRIAVLGAGNMGGALIGGIVNRVAPADHVAATTRTPERAAELIAQYGIHATAGSNRQAAERADLIVLAVKPGTLPKVLAEIRDVLGDGRRDSEAAGRVLGVGDGQIDRLRFDDVFQVVGDNAAAWRAENIAYK